MPTWDEIAGAGVTPTQMPTDPGRLQDSLGPVHASLQQTPLAQKVEAHCVPLMQGCPKASGVLVGVAVGVMVGVTVGVSVGVAVGGLTHVPSQAPPLPEAICWQ